MTQEELEKLRELLSSPIPHIRQLAFQIGKGRDYDELELLEKIWEEFKYASSTSDDVMLELGEYKLIYEFDSDCWKVKHGNFQTWPGDRTLGFRHLHEWLTNDKL